MALDISFTPEAEEWVKKNIELPLVNESIHHIITYLNSIGVECDENTVQFDKITQKKCSENGVFRKISYEGKPICQWRVEFINDKWTYSVEQLY